MIRLVPQWFSGVTSTAECRLKYRVWDGSDPIEQVCTRDQDSMARITEYWHTGFNRYPSTLTTGSGGRINRAIPTSIGTSGKRPSASDPYAWYENRKCTERWNAFTGRTSRQSSRMTEVSTEGVPAAKVNKRRRGAQTGRKATAAVVSVELKDVRCSSCCCGC